MCALFVGACNPSPEPEPGTTTSDTDNDATSSTPSSTSSTTSSDTTSNSTSGCSSELLGWEPQGATDLEPWGGTFAYAAILPPFEVDTVCNTVLVGVYTDEAECGSPTSIDVFAWALTDPAPPGGIFPLPTTYDLAEAVAVDIYTPKASVYRFHHATHWPASRYPMLGMVTSGACAIGGFPSCDPLRAWRYSDAWHTLYEDTGAEDQLFFGLADCGPEIQ